MAESMEEHVFFGDTLTIGKWKVEPEVNRIAQGDEVVQLEPKVMHVLLCMAERPGKTVTKERFMEEVWAGTVVTDDVLSRCISELRKALGDDTREPRYIETIRKTGYRLIAPVKVVGEASRTSLNGKNAEARRSSHSAEHRSGQLRRIWARLTVNSAYAAWGVAFLIVGVLIGSLLWQQSGQEVIESPPETIPFTSYPGVEAEPALSPDGQQVAFVWDEGEGGNQSIFVKQSSSETPLRITSAYADDYSPTWSPDGQQVAFARVSGSTHSIHIASSLGGSERRVARFGTREVHSLAWSPDTTRQILAAAVRSSAHGPFHIELIDLEADSTWTITSPEATSYGDLSPVFSSDGESIAFTRVAMAGHEDAYVVPAEGGSPRQVDFPAAKITGLTWDVEGRDLLIAAHRNGSAGLWRVPVAEGEPGWVMALSERNSLLRPTLSHNGNRLAYAQETESTNIWLWQPAAQGFESNLLVSSTRWDSNPALAPDSESVAFVSTRTGYQELWRAGVSQSEPVQLTDLKSPFTASPSWSPDSERIAFVSGQSDKATIYLVEAEGGAPRALTEEEHHDMMPSWSNSGEWIYFASDRGGTWQIWKVAPDTGETEQVTEEGGLAAQENADGSSLYVVRPDTAGIWQMDLEPSPDTPIVQAAFADEPLEQRPGAEENGLELVIPWISPDDYANWRVTERGIYFIRRRTDATVLSFYRFDSENISDVATLENVSTEGSLDVALDGSRFVLAQRDQHESDVMLVHNFR